MDPLMHVIIPALILTAIGYKLKNILKYSFLGVLPDVLYYTPFHRSLFHSYFVLVPICILIYYLAKNKETAAICAVFLLSHPLIDLGGYVAMFYPYPNYFRIYAEITMNSTDFSPLPKFGLEVVAPSDMDWVYTSYALQTSTSILFILLLSVFVFHYRQKIIKWIQDRLRV